jgi:hypothetical protein
MTPAPVPFWLTRPAESSYQSHTMQDRGRRCKSPFAANSGGPRLALVSGPALSTK